MDGLSLNSLRMSPAVHPVPGNDRSEVASLPTSNGHPKTLITWLQLWFSDKATWKRLYTILTFSWGKRTVSSRP